MHPSSLLPVMAFVLLASVPNAHAGAKATAATEPEIQREVGQAQAVGQVHTLRNIPEACVRLQGQFTGDAATPYRMESVPRDRCAPRAKYVEASALQTPPSSADGWTLNDVIRVPSAACPNQQAALSIWKHQVDPTKIALDGQGRMRMYMQDGNVTTPSGEKAHAITLYTATLKVSGGCG
jgi:hypothetical protein